MGQEDTGRGLGKGFMGAVLTAGLLTFGGPIQSHDEFH